MHSHEHHDHHHYAHTHGDTSGLRTAFFLNLAFTLIELVGGMLTNSVAIMADALHDLGDSVSLGLAWFLGNYATKASDHNYSYGYKRFSVLGALINTVILLVGSLVILSQTVPRLLNPEPTNAAGMIGLALLGVAINGFAALRIRGDKTLNARAVTLHLFEDALGWIGVLVVGVILLINPALTILDPVLSIIITAYVLYRVMGNLRETSRLFFQAVPDDINIRELEHNIMDLAGVLSIHHTHVWSLDGVHHVISTHVTVPSDATKELICSIKADIHDLMQGAEFEHVTIEVEYEDEPCGLTRHAHAHGQREVAPAK